MPPVLDVRHLTVELPTRGTWVKPVNDCSFTLDAGETLGIVGESGSGKTLLSLALMGLDPHGARISGEAWLAPRDGDGGAKNLFAATKNEMRALRGRDVAMIFQEPMTALNPVMRVGKQVAEAIRVHNSQLGEDEIERRALEALEKASVPDVARRATQYPHQLSGGLRQRVMIAMGVKEVQSVTALEDGQRWLNERKLCALQPTGQRPWTNLSPSKAHARRLRAP